MRRATARNYDREIYPNTDRTHANTLSQRFARSAHWTPITCLAIAPPTPDSLVPRALLQETFGPEVTAGPAVDVNGGRGVFSRVIKIPLLRAGSASTAASDHSVETDSSIPRAVVAKLPIPGPNGEAARTSGAYAREALAYQRLLPTSPIASPAVYAVAEDADGTTLLLEDLTGHRVVDQLDGLGADDAVAIADELATFHRHWHRHPELDRLDIRRSTPSALPPAALDAGLSALRSRWVDATDDLRLATFEAMVARRAELVERFSSAPAPTLCHGDPRADNLAFDPAPGGRPILFDWQQVAIQAGEADVAWLAATSLEVDRRRAVEEQLLAAYGSTIDRYRVGLILPGLAVLLLAQRRAADERTSRFIATSIDRIGAAITDLEVPALA